MLYFWWANYRYGIQFDYGERKRRGGVVTRVTNCNIYELGDYADLKAGRRPNLLFATGGVAEQHPSDQFSKEIGRRIALGRALKKATQPFKDSAMEAYKSRNTNMNPPGIAKLQNEFLTPEEGC